jgi:4-amino-4-deoxy-L-arabinose transferase-like glycosyltransferase
MRKNTILIAFAIALLAGFLRFYALGSVPPGIYPDEAVNATDGYKALETGHFKLFYQANNGREGLWMNLIGLSVKAFGANQFALRFWSALFGTLTVLGLFFLAKELMDSDQIALLSSFFIATSFWHLNFSRIAFRAILVPTLLVWSFYLLLKALHSDSSEKNQTPQPSTSTDTDKNKPHTTRQWLYALVSGLLFGLGLHTYIAFRFAPFAMLVLFGAEYFRARRGGLAIAPIVKKIAIWIFGAFITALPMFLYFAANPGDFLGRAGNVSIFGSSTPVQTFAKVLVQALGMFNIRGDCNWRHNLACSPALLFPVGIAFLIGIFIALRAIFRKNDSFKTAAWIIFGWFAFLLLPEVLTREGIPHALRSIGVIPPVFMLAGIGGDYILKKADRRKILKTTIVILILACGVIEIYRYFGVWATNANTPDAFARRYQQIGNLLNSAPDNAKKFVIVNANGVPVPFAEPDGSEKNIPMPAQTVMFVNLFKHDVTYLIPDDLPQFAFPPNSIIVPMEPDTYLESALESRGANFQKDQNGINYAVITR